MTRSDTCLRRCRSGAGAGATATVGAAVNIVYDRDTGNLYYDVNGGDGAGRTLFAKLAGDPDGVTAADFVVT